MQIEPYLSPCTKLNSKCIKNLNVDPHALNLIEEKVGNSLELIVTGDSFLNRTLMAQEIKSIINKWDFMKPKSFCKFKNTVNRIKQQLTEWEKICTNIHLARGYYLKHVNILIKTLITHIKYGLQS